MYILSAKLEKIVSLSWISSSLYYKLIYDLQKLITCLTVLVILIFQGHPSSFNIIKLMWSLLFDKVDLGMTVASWWFWSFNAHHVLAFHLYLQSLISFFVLTSFHAISYVLKQLADFSLVIVLEVDYWFCFLEKKVDCWWWFVVSVW